MYFESLLDMSQIRKTTQISIFIDYFDDGIMIDEKHYTTSYQNFIMCEMDNLKLRDKKIEEFRVQDMEINSMDFTKIILRYYEGTD